MQTAFRVKTRVLPGGRIEIADPHLATGESVEVIVLLPEVQEDERRSALDILAETPGHRLFQTGEEVDAYLREERDSWES